MREHLPFVRRLALPSLLPLLGLLGGCQGAVLDPAGDVALQQRNLIYASTGLMLLIIVPVMILIVLFAWRYRAGNKDATYDPKFDHSTSLELVIWSAPLLIIIALGALTWSSTHLLDPFRPLNRISASKTIDPRDKPLRVQVVSLDWKWLFIYPELGIATVNELVLPVDRQVRFDITSTNMMNTFYAPTLAGMVYAMPGMQSTLHAVLNRPGTFEGMSANYSGAGFSDMRFKLYGVAPADFDAWVARVKGSGKSLDTGNFLILEKPSEKVPAMYFAGVDPTLFDRVYNRCVKPGTPCMSDMMHTGSHAPPRTDQGKPEGALFEQGDEKGSGESLTPPPGAERSPAPHSHQER
jgi:cytochrome o ubiquinol oxidase subunit 2